MDMKLPLGSQLPLGHPATDGLIGCWMMNAGSGRIVNDLIGPWQGVHTTDMPWIAGPHGHAIDFPGGTVALNVGDMSLNLNQFTIMAWLMNDVGNTDNVWFGAGDSGYTQQLMVRIRYGQTRFQLGYGNGATTDYLGAGGRTMPPINTWFCDCWTLKAGVGNHYINGVFEQTDSGPDVNAQTPAGTNVGIGGFGRGAAFEGGWTGGIECVLLWSRALFAAEVRDMFIYISDMFREDPICLHVAAMGGAGAGTYIGAGSVSVQKATATALGTFTVPTYSGSGSVTIPQPIAAGTATFTLPVYTGSGSVTVGSCTATGSGTFTSPVYAGSGSVTVTKSTVTGSGTFTVPTYSGSGDVSVTKAIASGTGIFATVIYSGSGDVEVSKATVDGLGTFNVPTYDGIGNVSVQKVTVAGSGTFTVPTYSGSGAVIISQPTASGLGLFAAEMYIGSGSGVIAKAVAAGIGTFAVPVYAGTGVCIVSQPMASASGTFTAPVYQGTGAGMVSQPIASGMGTFAIPGVYTGLGYVTATKASVMGSGTFSTLSIASLAFLLMKRRK